MGKLLFFIFQPFLAFINAVKNFNSKGSGLVYILFFGLFGYAISFQLTSADSYRIAARFCQTDYASDLIWLMYKEGSLTDVYLIGIYSLLKPFTNNPKILFGVLGLGMGLFSYLCMREVFKLWGTRCKTRQFVVVAFCFFLAISFFNVNGIRFWTANAMYAYFAIKYLFEGKKQALIGIMLTPLVHFGFFIAVGAMLIFIIFNILNINNSKVYFYLMILCFVGSMAMPRTLADDMMNGDDTEQTTGNRAIDRKVSAYVKTTDNVGAQNQKMKQNNSKSAYRQANAAFTSTFNLINRFGIFFLMYFLYKHRNKLNNGNDDYRMLNFTLFMCAIGFFATFAIGSGARFLRLANMFVLFYFLYVYANSGSYLVENKSKWIIIINFYAISFLFFNAPRIVEPSFWILPVPFTIYNGLDFGAIDFV